MGPCTYMERLVCTDHDDQLLLAVWEAACNSGSEANLGYSRGQFCLSACSPQCGRTMHLARYAAHNLWRSAVWNREFLAIISMVPFQEQYRNIYLRALQGLLGRRLHKLIQQCI